MTLPDFEKAIGADHFDMCMESKDPYWFINYHIPTSFVNNVVKEPVLTVLTNQETSEILAICTPKKGISAIWLEGEALAVKVYLDVILDSITNPSDA